MLTRREERKTVETKQNKFLLTVLGFCEASSRCREKKMRQGDDSHVRQQTTTLLQQQSWWPHCRSGILSPASHFTTAGVSDENLLTTEVKSPLACPDIPESFKKYLGLVAWHLVVISSHPLFWYLFVFITFIRKV